MILCVIWLLRVYFAFVWDSVVIYFSRQNVRKSRQTQLTRRSLVQWEAHDYPGVGASFSAPSHGKVQTEALWNCLSINFPDKVQCERTQWNSEIFGTLAGGDCGTFSCILTFRCLFIVGFSMFFSSRVRFLRPRFPKPASKTNLTDFCKCSCAASIHAPFISSYEISEPTAQIYKQSFQEKWQHW